MRRSLERRGSLSHLWRAALSGVLAASCFSCVGSIGDRPEGGNPPWDQDGDGQVDDEFQVGTSEMRRLTRVEYQNSLRDLFGQSVVDALGVAIAALPNDQVEHDFSSLSNTITSNHVDAYFVVADALADLVSADAGQMGALETCLGAASPDDGCVQTFVERFGRRVFRRPLLEEEIQSLLGTYADGKALAFADGMKLLLLAMMQDPAFIYRVEIDGPSVEGLADAYQLTDYELAARLSFFAWASTPDEELLDAAGDGSLATDEGRDLQIERLFADPRAVAQVQRFFGEWLETDRIPNVQQSDEFLMGIPKEGLADDMRAEIASYAAYHVFDTAGTYADLMTSDVSYVASDALAQVYGAPAASPDEPVQLEGGRRNGLLTRAGLLAHTGEETHPIQRGARFRRKLLCEDIAPPDPSQFPPNAIAPPAYDPDASARERWTAQTSAPGCAACHGLINPIGFALENYDNIGRYRETEPIIDPDTGEQVNSIPIDSQVGIPIDSTTPVEVDGAVGLGEALADHEQANRCFGTQWFRFVQGRRETSSDDSVIEALLETGTVDGGSILQMFQRIAQTPQFRLRRVKL